MDPGAGGDGSRSSHRHRSSHSGSHHGSRGERPPGSEASHDSSGRLTNMSHATSAASDRYKYSTGPPGSGQRQYEWIKTQQGMSRENYSPSIESLRSGHGSSPRLHHSSGKGSRFGSRSMATSSSPSSGSSHSGASDSGSHHDSSRSPDSNGSHQSGSHHSRSHHSGSHHSGSHHSGSHHSGSHRNGSHQSTRHYSGSHHASTGSLLAHEPSGSVSDAAHEPRDSEREQRDRKEHISRRDKNNPNQPPVSPFIIRLSQAICYSLGMPRLEKEEKHDKK
ncbi:hypothetical protein EV426DRAFT_702325 [Tirmania nivea]|nr:hypothetical protein EV426DRAFT_702325 [Tirmania nivea]